MRRPSAGSKNICSKMTAPPINKGICNPMRVMIGIIAFFKTCLRITTRSFVGSRTGAPTVGSGGNSNRFRVGPQSGSRGHVSSPRLVKRSMRISRTTLSCLLRVKGYVAVRVGSAFRAAHSSRFLLHLFQPCPPVFPPGSAFAFTYILCLRSRSLIGAFIISPLPPMLPKSLQTAGPLPSTGVTRLHRYYQPLRHPLACQPTSRCSRLYGLPCSADFSPGRGGLLQLLSASSLPCRRYHPAGVPQRLSQSALRHAAFVQDLGTQPPSFLFFEATCAFTLVTARQLAGHPLRWPCQWASGHRFLSSLPSMLRGSGSYPGGSVPR